MNVERPTRAGLAPWAATALLVVVVLLSNANSLGAFFVGDDFDFLVRMQRMGDVGDTLTMSYWGEWEPLWYLGFYRDWSLFGLNPTAYHLANLFWLALGVIGLYHLVAALWPEARLAPLAAALLFATHPLHDEAVTYIAARGHPMSAALMLIVLFCYVRWRRLVHRRRWVWLGLGLLAALAGALAKETALILPLLIAKMEWCVFQRMRPRVSAVWGTIRRALPFMAPPVVYLWLRHLAVGLGSQKLRGPDDGITEFIESCLRYIPQYALAGGLPLPFAFAGRESIEALSPLGWMIALTVFVPAMLLTIRALWREGKIGMPLGVFLFALGLVIITLLPVFWADLGLRRRYFYVPSIGAALAAAVVLEWMYTRRTRAAWVLTLALTVAGMAGLISRNEMYRASGAISRDLYETARGAPMGQPSIRREGERRRVALVTLPRYLGGDDFSGAYLLHRTDARSTFRLAGVEPAEFSAALKCYYAGDYTAAVEFSSFDLFRLTVSFRTRQAYEAARDRDPQHDRVGKLIEAIRIGADDRRRVLTYEVNLAGSYLRTEHNELYYYSDGTFRRLARPE